MSCQNELLNFKILKTTTETTTKAVNTEQASPWEKKWRSISSSPKSWPSFLKWSLWYCWGCCFLACIHGLDGQHVGWQHSEGHLMPQWGHWRAPCAFTSLWFSLLLSPCWLQRGILSTLQQENCTTAHSAQSRRSTVTATIEVSVRVVIFLAGRC